MARPTVIVILGQTTTGKSDLAVRLAKKLGGEVISADSRQVYKGLNIGTGKITPKEMRGVPHHLLDIANPRKKFAVTEYQSQAVSAMADIASRSKVPVLCGGTGFYIDAVTEGVVFPEVPPNTKLRRKLEKKASPELFRILVKLDKHRARNIDRNNKRRLVRAIEISKALGKIPRLASKPPRYDFKKIGLYLPEKKLKKRIEKRLSRRMKAGMLGEAKKLRQNGLSWRRMVELGLEYKFMALYLQNRITRKEMLENLNTEIYQYAKRQMTWFKRDKAIKWVDASKPKELHQAIRECL